MIASGFWNIILIIVQDPTDILMSQKAKLEIYNSNKPTTDLLLIQLLVERKL